MYMSREAGKPTQPHQFCQVKWVKIQEAGGGISQSMYVQYDYKKRKEKKVEIRNSLYYYSDISKF